MSDHERNADPLLQALSRLPRDIEPARDLWPDIAAGIGHRHTPLRRRWQWLQVAATLAGVAIVTAIAVRTLSTGGLPGDANIARTPSALMAPSLAPPVDTTAYTPEWFSDGMTSVALNPAYQTARASLAEDLFRQLEKLPAAERDKIEQGLRQIDSGLQAISEALASQPDSILLQQLVLSAYQTELQFMQNVRATTDAALGSDSI